MGVKGVTFFWGGGSLDFFPGGRYGGTPPKKLKLKVNQKLPCTLVCRVINFKRSPPPTWKDQQIDNVV